MENKEIMEFVNKHICFDETIATNRNINIILNDILSLLKGMKDPSIEILDNDPLSLTIIGDFVNQPNHYLERKKDSIEIKIDPNSHTISIHSFILNKTDNNDQTKSTIDNIKYSFNDGYLNVDREKHVTLITGENSIINEVYVKKDKYNRYGIQESDLVTKYRLNNKEGWGQDGFHKSKTDAYLTTENFSICKPLFLDYEKRLLRNSFYSLTATGKKYEGTYNKKTIEVPEKEYMIAPDKGFINLIPSTAIDKLSKEEIEKYIETGINATEDNEIRKLFEEEYNNMNLDDIDNVRKR